MLFEPQEEVGLVDLGPLRVSEPWFSRRMRVHQAWYRASVLGVVGYGRTRPPNERPLGSILPDDAAAGGLNFHSAATSELFDERRSQGWGIDPVRTLAYLTSSQAMTLNVFGPLIASPRWMCAVLNEVLISPAPITSIEAVSVEYFSPNPSKALGDRTTVDVLIHAQCDSAPVMIAIETKLGDRFNSRRVSVSPAYAKVGHLWTSPDAPTRHDISQLARVHALAEHVACASYGSAADATRLLVLHHADDPRVGSHISDYRLAITNKSTLESASLSQFLAAMRATARSAAEQALVDSLWVRYASVAASDSVWREFLSTFRLGPAVERDGR